MRRAGLLAVAFALLAGCCAFLAVAGPRQDLATRTQALHQTLATLPSTDTAIVGSAEVSQALEYLNGAGDGNFSTGLTPAQLAESVTQLQALLRADGLSAGPAWVSITTRLASISTPVPAAAEPAGLPPRMEISYRSDADLAHYAPLVSGTYPSAADSQGVAVVVTQATAALLHLHPGSTVTIPGQSRPLILTVTGIVRPVQTAATFWLTDVLLQAPEFIQQKNVGNYWNLGMFTDDSQAAALQDALGVSSTLAWSLPLNLSQTRADQVPGLIASLQTATSQTVSLQGDIAPVGPAITLAQTLSTTISAFLQTESATEDLSWLTFISLAATAAAVLLLAARLLTASRREELALLRARGASARQVFLTPIREFGIVSLASCVAGAGLGLLVAGGTPTPMAAWSLAAAVAAIALLVPPTLAVTAVRAAAGGAIADGEAAGLAGTANVAGPARRARFWRRVLIEGTLVVAAVAGLIVYRRQPASVSGVNVFASTAPVLVAIPVVIVVARLVPLAVALARKLTGRRAGAPVFVALARAARPTGLTVFAMVMALTLCAFGGMVRDAIVRGEVAASWQQNGADYAIDAPGAGTFVPSAHPLSTPNEGWFNPSARAAITRLPGISDSTTVFSTAGIIPDQQSVIVLAVNPASYAAFTASTPDWPKISAAELARGAIVSPQLAGSVTGNQVTITSDDELTGGGFTVPIAGTVTATPAQPGGSLFMIVDTTVLHGPAQYNLMLLNGSSISPSALSSVVAKAVPGAVINRRSDIVNALANAPLQRGTYIMLLLGILAAALLAGAAVGSELAYGAAERDKTLARLAAMGLTERQRVGLIAIELTPTLLGAAVAAAACALALPPLLAPALNLGVFTGGSASSVPLRPDLLSFALPLAALILLAAGSVLFGARRKDLVSRLRMGGR
jgi:putative ABC transport system permease protein